MRLTKLELFSPPRAIAERSDRSVLLGPADRAKGIRTGAYDAI